MVLIWLDPSSGLSATTAQEHWGAAFHFQLFEPENASNASMASFEREPSQIGMYTLPIRSA
jgi:hypothetical protein